MNRKEILNLNDLAQEIHLNAIAHGWWEEERSFGEIIALCHSELSEALEEYRKGHTVTTVYANFYTNGGKFVAQRSNPDLFEGNKPEGIPIELADCIIRILDYCCKVGIDIDEAIRIKHEYNKTRPYKHGGKAI